MAGAGLQRGGVDHALAPALADPDGAGGAAADAQHVHGEESDRKQQELGGRVHWPDSRVARLSSRSTRWRQAFCGLPTNAFCGGVLGFEPPHPLRGASLAPKWTGLALCIPPSAGARTPDSVFSQPSAGTRANYAALTAFTSLVRESLASPKNMIVFGS